MVPSSLDSATTLVLNDPRLFDCDRVFEPTPAATERPSASASPEMLLSVLVVVLLLREVWVLLSVSVLATALEFSFAFALTAPPVWVEVAVAVWLLDWAVSALLLLVGFAHT